MIRSSSSPMARAASHDHTVARLQVPFALGHVPNARLDALHAREYPARDNCIVRRLAATLLFMAEFAVDGDQVESLVHRSSVRRTGDQTSVARQVCSRDEEEASGRPHMIAIRQPSLPR